MPGRVRPAQTKGVLANEAWPYFDTYNIHSYDPPIKYLKLFTTACDAASGRPIWLSEWRCPRGPRRPSGHGATMTPADEMKQATFVARSYASSLYAGVERHFFFILGNYIEKGVQFGLIRHDHTPRPGYVALAAVGRLLADAKSLGRVPSNDDGTGVYAFAAVVDGAA